MRRLKNAKLNNKSVIVRCDFNVPLDDKGNITSFKRIDSTKETIDYLLSKNCKVILCSHMGRPKGKRDESLSLKCVYEYLKAMYPHKVNFCAFLDETSISNAKKVITNGNILLLENLRFDAGEENNSEEFAKILANGVDAFVDEAFATSHRSCASNDAIKKFLPAYMGFNYEKEIKGLTFKDKPAPILAILGGAKVSDKIELISKMINKVDYIYIGGALAHTFMYAMKYNINKNIVELDKVNLALKLIDKAKKHNKKLLFPLDAYALDNDGNKVLRTLNQIKETDVCLDIGEKSIKDIKNLIAKAKTIFWNGPIGKVSDERFANGTKEVAKCLAQSKAFTIVGGGDTVAEIEKYNLQDKISFVSTGGGASLKYIQKG